MMNLSGIIAHRQKRNHNAAVAAAHQRKEEKKELGKIDSWVFQTIQKFFPKRIEPPKR